jgi:WD40 repeat protein
VHVFRQRDTVTSMAVINDVTVACGAADGVVRICDLRSGLCSGGMRGHTDAARRSPYSAAGGLTAAWGQIVGLAAVDASTLLSASADGTVRVWSTATRRSTRVIAAHSAAITATAFAAAAGAGDSAGPVLVSGARNGTVRLWCVCMPAATWGGGG